VLFRSHSLLNPDIECIHVSLNDYESLLDELPENKWEFKKVQNKTLRFCGIPVYKNIDADDSQPIVKLKEPCK
jgi:hypothetical protein